MAGAVLVLALLLSGCGGGAPPTPAPAAPSSAAPAPDAVQVPADGLPLAAFGYQFGPLDTLSLPRSTRLAAAVDQADGVTVVLSAPSLVEVVGYLRRALPAGGFTITADGGATTLTFRGHGWTGSVTSGGGTTAVLLRPS
jgi:hypothetical protein